MSQNLIKNDKYYFRFIVVISILVPVVVGMLYFLPKESMKPGFDIYLLPKLNAIINSTVTLLLIAGYLFIRQRKIGAHQTSMAAAFLLSAVFLVSYIIYHRYGHTNFGGEGGIKTVYLLILFTHIVLSAAVVPLVLITIYYSTSGQFAKHRKIARWTLPIWLYVSITGVIVYLMISPYYPA
jgi:putative membrane protein